MLNTGTIYGINGPVIYLKGNTGFRMSEMVYVGSQKLVGEVIALDKDMTTVQVYEETTGLYPGEEVIASGSAVSVTLAPGILNRKSGRHISPWRKDSIFTAEILSRKCLKPTPSCINAWFLLMWKELLSM